MEGPPESLSSVERLEASVSVGLWAGVLWKEAVGIVSTAVSVIDSMDVLLEGSLLVNITVFLVTVIRIELGIVRVVPESVIVFECECLRGEASFSVSSSMLVWEEGRLRVTRVLSVSESSEGKLAVKMLPTADLTSMTLSITVVSEALLSVSDMSRVSHEPWFEESSSRQPRGLMHGL
jgi:hypothetical protein